MTIYSMQFYRPLSLKRLCGKALLSEKRPEREKKLEFNAILIYILYNLHLQRYNKQNFSDAIGVYSL